MAKQTDLGKGVLIGGIVAAVLSIAAGVVLLPEGKKNQPINIPQNDMSGYNATNKATQAIINSIGTEGKDKKSTKINVAAKHSLVDETPESASTRVAPLGIAPEMWQIGTSPDVVDIYDNANQIHQGVDNTWFLQHGLSSVMSKANALTTDSDGDGFSNGEEYLHSNPQDASSTPGISGSNYIKLEIVGKAKTKKEFIQLDSAEIAYVEEKPEFIVVKIFGSKAGTDEDKDLRKNELRIGDSFGISKKEETRFKLLDITPGEQGSITVLDTKNPAKGEETAGFTIKHGKNNRKEIKDIHVQLRVTGGKAKGQTVDTLLGLETAFPGSAELKFTVTDLNEDGSCQVLISGQQTPVTVPAAQN